MADQKTPQPQKAPQAPAQAQKKTAGQPLDSAPQAGQPVQKKAPAGQPVKAPPAQAAPKKAPAQQAQQQPMPPQQPIPPQKHPQQAAKKAPAAQQAPQAKAPPPAQAGQPPMKKAPPGPMPAPTPQQAPPPRKAPLAIKMPTPPPEMEETAEEAPLPIQEGKKGFFGKLLGKKEKAPTEPPPTPQPETLDDAAEPAQETTDSASGEDAPAQGAKKHGFLWNLLVAPILNPIVAFKNKVVAFIKKLVKRVVLFLSILAGLTIAVAAGIYFGSPILMTKALPKIFAYFEQPVIPLTVTKIGTDYMKISAPKTPDGLISAQEARVSFSASDLMDGKIDSLSFTGLKITIDASTDALTLPDMTDFASLFSKKDGDPPFLSLPRQIEAKAATLILRINGQNAASLSTNLLFKRTSDGLRLQAKKLPVKIKAGLFSTQAQASTSYENKTPKLTLSLEGASLPYEPFPLSDIKGKINISLTDANRLKSFVYDLSFLSFGDNFSLTGLLKTLPRKSENSFSFNTTLKNETDRLTTRTLRPKEVTFLGDSISLNVSEGQLTSTAPLSLTMLAKATIKHPQHQNADIQRIELTFPATVEKSEKGLALSLLSTAKMILTTPTLTLPDMSLSGAKREEFRIQNDKTPLLLFTEKDGKAITYLHAPMGLSSQLAWEKGGLTQNMILQVPSLLAQGHIQNGSPDLVLSTEKASIETPSVKLDDISLALRLTGKNSRGKLNGLTLTSKADPAYIAPLTIQGDLLLQGTNSAFKLMGLTQEQMPLVSLSGRLDLRRITGEATLRTPLIQLNPAAIGGKSLSLAKTAPFLADKIVDPKGHSLLKGTLTWEDGAFGMNLGLLLHGIDAGIGSVSGKNVNGVLDILSLDPFITGTDQYLHAERLSMGLPLEDAHVIFRFTEEGHFHLARASAQLAGGTIEPDATLLRPDNDWHKIVLNMAAIDVAALSPFLNLENFQATGSLSGRIPLYISANDIIVRNGKIDASTIEKIMYDPDERPSDPTMAQITDVLGEFNVEKLKIALETHSQNVPAADGTMSTKYMPQVALDMAGSNPTMFEGRSIKLNTTITADLEQIVRPSNKTYPLPDYILTRKEELAGQPLPPIGQPKKKSLLPQLAPKKQEPIPAETVPEAPVVPPLVAEPAIEMPPSAPAIDMLPAEEPVEPPPFEAPQQPAAPDEAPFASPPTDSSAPINEMPIPIMEDDVLPPAPETTEEGTIDPFQMDAAPSPSAETDEPVMAPAPPAMTDELPSEAVEAPPPEMDDPFGFLNEGTAGKEGEDDAIPDLFGTE